MDGMDFAGRTVLTACFSKCVKINRTGWAECNVNVVVPCIHRTANAKAKVFQAAIRGSSLHCTASEREPPVEPSVEDD